MRSDLPPAHEATRRELAEPDSFWDQRLALYLYTLPVVGFFPALWTVYYRRGGQERQALSRVVVTLTLGWLITYVLLGMGAESSSSLAMKLWLANSVVTSGYFLTSLWLMVMIWRRKSVRLPLISHIGDRLP